MIMNEEGDGGAALIIESRATTDSTPRDQGQLVLHERVALSMTEQKRYKRSDIVERNTKNDSVFIIDNIVYDVTKFLDDHPGGHEVLVNVAGQDASEDFHDVGHSVDAKNMMKKYAIGDVVDEDRIESKKRGFAWNDTAAENTSESFLSSWKFPVVLGLLITILYSYLFG